MRRRLLVLLAGVAATLALTASPAQAYGGGANHDMWQIGVSFNCNNSTFCQEMGLGGFWGWAELDRSATQTWGDAEFAFCFHTAAGGGAGAGHTSQDIEGWYIAPGSAGPQTFYISGTETDTFRGMKQTSEFTNEDSGISAVPGHYTAADIFGFRPPPGVAIQIQIAFRPAK